MATIFLAFGLMLLFESLGPLLFPKRWKRLLLQLGRMPAIQLRQVGWALLVVALFLLWIAGVAK